MTISNLIKNDTKFSRWIENTVRKGEIARYEQFLLFPQFFKGLVLQTRKKQGLFGKGLKELSFHDVHITHFPNRAEYRFGLFPVTLNIVSTLILRKKPMALKRVVGSFCERLQKVLFSPTNLKNILCLFHQSFVSYVAMKRPNELLSS